MRENQIDDDTESRPSVWRRLWEWIRETLSLGEFLRNASLLAGATALSRGLLAAVSPILTRLYSASDFGVLAVFSGVLSISIAAVALCYHLAIPVPEDDEDAVNLLASALCIVPIVSAIIGGGFWVFRGEISTSLGAPSFSKYVWLLPLGLMGRGTYQSLNYWAVRVKGYRVLARTRIAQGVASAGTQVGLGALAFGPVGLIVGKILGRTSGVGSLAILAKKAGRVWEAVHPRRMMHQLNRYRRFALIAVPGQLLNNAGLHAPALLLSTFFGSTVTGWFALAERVLNAPISLVSKAIQQVYFGEASERIRERPGGMLNLYDEVSWKLFALGVLPATVSFVWGPDLFEFVFGADWRTAGEYVRILSPMLLARFVASPLSQTLNILERQGTMFLWEALRLALIVTAFVGGGILGWTDTQTIVAFSGAASASYVGMYLITREVLRRIAVEAGSHA